MSQAINFLEKVSIPVSEEDSDIIENVSISDAIYATKLAVLEFATELKNIMDSDAKIMDDLIIHLELTNKIRQLNKEHIKLS